jgi:hypothetical protein
MGVRFAEVSSRTTLLLWDRDRIIAELLDDYS